MEQHNIPIRVIDLYSFESLALIKAFKKNLAKLIYKVQYAIEGRLAEGERSRLWNKILKKYIDFMNNSKTRLRSEEHTSELQSRFDLVCRLLLEKKNIII